MRGGVFGGCNHSFGVWHARQAGDIFSDRAVKQVHLLRQIANIAAQNIRIILIKRSTI